MLVRLKDKLQSCKHTFIYYKTTTIPLFRKCFPCVNAFFFFWTILLGVWLWDLTLRFDKKAWLTVWSLILPKCDLQCWGHSRLCTKLAQPCLHGPAFVHWSTAEATAGLSKRGSTFWPTQQHVFCCCCCFQFIHTYSNSALCSFSSGPVVTTRRFFQGLGQCPLNGQQLQAAEMALAHGVADLTPFK